MKMRGANRLLELVYYYYYYYYNNIWDNVFAPSLRVQLFPQHRCLLSMASNVDPHEVNGKDANRKIRQDYGNGTK